MRDLDKNPYSPDERRVAEFFFERGLGGGDDPIGAILASHQALADERNELKRAWLLGGAGTKHSYPSRHPPGSHWATDAGWEILDMLKPDAISPDIRAWLAGAIAGRLMREHDARIKP